MEPQGRWYKLWFLTILITEFDSSKYDFEFKFESDFNRSRIRGCRDMKSWWQNICAAAAIDDAAGRDGAAREAAAAATRGYEELAESRKV